MEWEGLLFSLTHGGLMLNLATFAFSGVDWKMTDVQIATKLRG